jgi:type I restriction enzyme R subunit
MSRIPDEPVLPTEPDAEAHADAGEDEEGYSHYEEFDKKRRAMLKEKLGVTLRLSQVQYTGADGELVTESYLDYARHTLLAQYPTFETFSTAWFTVKHKQSIVARLFEQGIFIDELQEELGMDLDEFDLLCQLAFERKGLTRRERAEKVRSRPGYFEKYGKSARHMLDLVLTRFSENGYMTLDDVLDQSRLVYFLRFLPHNTLGRPSKLVRAFGGKVRFDQAMRELQDLLYQD